MGFAEKVVESPAGAQAQNYCQNLAARVELVPFPKMARSGVSPRSLELVPFRFGEDIEFFQHASKLRSFCSVDQFEFSALCNALAWSTP